ncbi:MAG: ornithine cyclodeaminase family protein [Chloroflexi bacterium]|nr:ornithine cyclodeaminase family protein [Chloroflexota bacterium]
MLILTRKDVQELLDPQELLPALEEGFKALSAGQLEVPPRNQVGAPKGVLLGMYAFMPGNPFSVKLVSIFHESTPSHQAIIILFDSETGAPIALMDGEHVTAMRTAAASLLSIKHLARQNAKNVAIVGTGVQGESHLKMIETLDGIEEIWVASRTSRFQRGHCLSMHLIA